MRVLIVANGEPGNGPPPGPFDQIVAADGGAGLCRQAGLQPNLIVGDMDSLPAALRLLLPSPGMPGAGSGEERTPRFQIHPDPVNKDETDLELAIQAAVTLRPAEVVFWGIWGGRPDHTLSNVLALAHPALAGIAVSAYADGWWLRLAGDNQVISLDIPLGTLVSLIPLTARVTGLFTAGLQYPLPPPHPQASPGRGKARPGGILLRGFGRGISNVVISRPATIRVGRGLLLVACGPA